MECEALLLSKIQFADVLMDWLSPQTTVHLYPFQIHSVALSSFASIMGPFGGFFASGFKRAFKIKVLFLNNDRFS